MGELLKQNIIGAESLIVENPQGDESTVIPKGLLDECLKLMNAWCRERFIEASRYRFVEIFQDDVVFRAEFHTEKPRHSDFHIQIYSIYYDAQKKYIMQCGIDFSK